MVHLLQLINLHWCIIITHHPYFTLGFTPSVVQSEILDKCIMTGIHHYRIIQNSFTALKILCAPSIQPLLNPWQLLIFFTVSVVLIFPECHIYSCNPTVFSFSDWLLSLSKIHLNLPHIFSWLASSFLFSIEEYFIVCMYLSFFFLIHLLTYWRTSWLLSSFDNYE